MAGALLRGDIAAASLELGQGDEEPSVENPAQALALAAELSARGLQRAAASLLQPHRNESAKLALAHARAASATMAPADALDTWAEAFSRFPSAAIAVSYATALADELRYAEAFQLLDDLIASDGRASLHLARVRLLERTGALREAEAAAAALVVSGNPLAEVEADRLARDIGHAPARGGSPALPSRDDPNWAPSARREVNALIAAGSLRDAVSLANDVMLRRGDANDAFALTNAVLLTGDLEEGRRLATRFAARFVADARFALKLGQLAERAGDARAMLDGFARARAAGRSGTAVDSGIARAFLLDGKLDRAREWIDHAGAAAWTHCLRALVEARAGRPDAARAALDGAYGHALGRREAYRAGRNRNPSDCLMVDGRHLSHPSPRILRSADLFDRFLNELSDGGRTMLVGNSPRILDEKRGPEIDGCAHIVRLNDFRIAGFEAAVGQRTDWWFSSANRQAEPDRASIGGARAILTQSPPQHLPELPAFTRGRLRLDLGPDQACFLPPFAHDLSDNLLYPGRTTGLRMILILEFIVQAPFETIGFDFFTSSGLHYFQNGADRLLVGESHAVEFERAFVAEVLTPFARFGRYAL